MLCRYEGSFHKAQKKKMMDWFKQKGNGKHKNHRKPRIIKGRRKHIMEGKKW